MGKRRAQGPDLFTPRCETCNRPMIRTESGFLACPMGHGKLHVETCDNCGTNPPEGSLAWCEPCMQQSAKQQGLCILCGLVECDGVCEGCRAGS